MRHHLIVVFAHDSFGTWGEPSIKRVAIYVRVSTDWPLEVSVIPR
jgi:hypothetical protein